MELSLTACSMVARTALSPSDTQGELQVQFIPESHIAER